MEVVVARRGIVVLRLRPGDTAAQTGRCSRLLLLWAFAVGLAVGLFLFASHLLASVAAALLLAAMCFYTCLCLNAATEEQPPPPLRVAVMTPAGRARRQQEVVNGGGGGGLRQEDVEAAIPAFEYRKGGEAAAAPEEQCAVCIGVVRRGETVRRLPACGHAFHAPCIDGWLRAHATCPMCRADVKVAIAVAGHGGGGGATPV